MSQLQSFFTSRKIIKSILFLLSVVFGILLYLKFFINLLPMFFSNMENIEKNILAVLLIIFSTYLLINIALNLDNKLERYSILGIYLLILILGLLRPDNQISFKSGLINLNPLDFITDIKTDESSLPILIINLIIFVPMYFLLAKANIFNKFINRFLLFELFAFLIEYLQFQLKVGIFDLSDIFLYNIGFFAGYIIFLPFLKILKKKSYNKTVKGDN